MLIYYENYMLKFKMRRSGFRENMIDIRFFLLIFFCMDLYLSIWWVYFRFVFCIFLVIIIRLGRFSDLFIEM